MSDLVGNPEDRFSHNEAHISLTRSSKDKLVKHMPSNKNVTVVVNIDSTYKISMFEMLSKALVKSEQPALVTSLLPMGDPGKLTSV